MWCYLSPLPSHKLMQFEFDLTRGSRVVDGNLKSFKGYLQTDGYSGYTHQQERSDIVCFGCFAHARRKFAEIIKISGSKTGKAHEGLKYMTGLYRIEQKARELKMDFIARQALREAEALPLLNKFYQWLVQSEK
jgi:hypothetical protein